MKKIYWKPRAISRRALALIALLSLAGVAIVERFPVQSRQANYAEKLAAAELASNAFVAVKEARIAAGHPVDLSSDPLNSGLIGVPMSASRLQGCATPFPVMVTRREMSGSPAVMQRYTAAAVPTL